MSAIPHALALCSYVEALKTPSIVLDQHYRIVSANAAYRSLFASGQAVVGRTCYDVSHGYSKPCDQAGEVCPLKQAMASGQQEKVLHLHHSSQGQEHVEIVLTPVRGEDGHTWFVEHMQPMRVLPKPAHRRPIGNSPAFLNMMASVAQVAKSPSPVMLLGESGSGKEVVAQAVHDASPRAAAPLVPVECSSLNEGLFESELFGHEKGAFTGATVAKQGLVEAASGGTLFLDELGDIPLSIQVKLLRLIESGTYRCVGSTELRRADIRVISATHRNMGALMKMGAFREDLFYRLSTFPIEVPPLRERLRDIPKLVEILLERIASPNHAQIDGSAMEVLQAYPWPGNVRELRNILERAWVVSSSDVISAHHIQQALNMCKPFHQSLESLKIDERSALRPTVSTSSTLADISDTALADVVRQHQGSRVALAASLGISERSLYRKLQALQKRGLLEGRI